MNTQISAKSNKSTAPTTATQPQVNVRTVRAVPRVDILENPDELLLVAELPGVAADQLELKFANDTLTLRGTRQPEISGTPLLGQPVALEYSRSFVLPTGLDATRFTAKHLNGLLEVHMPKAASHKARTIAVKAG
jgi:HSP20 family protein